MNVGEQKGFGMCGEKNRETLREFIAETFGEEIALWDNCDEAIVGTASRCGMNTVIAYDYELLIDVFMNQGMTYDEAVDWIEYNIMGAYIGEYTPVIINFYDRH